MKVNMKGSILEIEYRDWRYRAMCILSRRRGFHTDADACIDVMLPETVARQILDHPQECGAFKVTATLTIEPLDDVACNPESS